MALSERFSTDLSLNTQPGSCHSHQKKCSWMLRFAHMIPWNYVRMNKILLYSVILLWLYETACTARLFKMLDTSKDMICVTHNVHFVVLKQLLW